MTGNLVDAVIVTYNRKQLLYECICSLLNQTKKLNRIIIIDNASTDGTYELLKDNNLLDIGVIEYLRMDTNTGGAGGFYYGIKKDMEFNSDWVWIMDDDTIPEKDCLEKLINAKLFLEEKNNKISYLASSVFGPNGEVMNVPSISHKLSSNGYEYWYKHLNKGLVNIETATFVSILVNKLAIQKCGLPCKDFFIWGDDIEYTSRLSSFYSDAYFVGDSVAIHKRIGAKSLILDNEESVGRIKMFSYYFRNQMITNRYYHRSNHPVLHAMKRIILGLSYLKQPNGLLKYHALAKGYIESILHYHKFKTIIDNELKGE